MSSLPADIKIVKTRINKQVRELLVVIPKFKHVISYKHVHFHYLPAWIDSFFSDRAFVVEDRSVDICKQYRKKFKSKIFSG